MLLFLLLHIYFVSFLDKPEKTAPQLSPRAVAQRAKWHIATDQMDYPVSTMYVDSLRRMGVRIHHVSRWFNGATCEMTESQAAKVKSIRFVTGVETTRDNSEPRVFFAPWKIRQAAEMPLDGRWTDAQLALYNLTPLHQAGFEGQGILMTVCDGAFYNANTLSCFRSMQELGHFDFTDDTDDFYGTTGTHGTECLSTISGINNGYYGAATRSDYYLMRTEENDTESPKEMDNLVAAFEKADSLGVNVFSVSLGYGRFDNYDWDLDSSTELNGRSTRVSRAATIAARKGMLVCVAAGNEGDGAWRTISAPADADSILTVGAVTTDSIIGSFSSYGPTSDGRVKPEVCANGVRTTLIAPSGTTVNYNGTSFATPLIAGLASCLWSALPNENAMQIRERIIRSAHLYPSYDPQHQAGYGIPNAWTAYTMSLPAEVEKVQSDKVQGTKVLRNGQIYILVGDKMYNMMGEPLPTSPQGRRIGDW